MIDFMNFIRFFGMVKDQKKNAEIVFKALYEFLKKESEYVSLSEYGEESFCIRLANYSVSFKLEVELEKVPISYLIAVDLMKKDDCGIFVKKKKLGEIEIDVGEVYMPKAAHL